MGVVNLLALIQLKVINNVSLFTGCFTVPTYAPPVHDVPEPPKNKLWIEDVIFLVIYPSVSNNTSLLGGVEIATVAIVIAEF